ncbi:MAG: class I SAM-dependent methyltransferase [Campylobacterota bacterium]|nr:class I SAM-dependent methyltransferase [Campylobacterota bacterium]
MPRINSEKFYTSAIEMHGTSAQGVNWASKENQELRFNAILDFLPKELNSYKVADAGCGFGDFYNYMRKKKKHPKQYIGIDSLLDMYSIACDNTGCEIIIADITKETLPKTDYYICSGALNVLTKFETHQFIQNCYNSSKIGFIFNALHGDKESETYNYLSRQEIESIAQELNVKEIAFKDGYLKDDITVGFFR